MKNSEELANVIINLAAIAGLFLLGCFIENLERMM